MATVDIHYVRAALRCAERKGVVVEKLINEIGISQAQLNQFHGRAHSDQITRLVQSIWSELNDEFMGCTEHPCKQGVFALMARHSLHYESLEAVLRQGIHFYNLFTDDIQMQLVPQGDMVTLEIEFTQPELDPDHFYQEFWMVIWHRFASWIIGKKIPLEQVCFTYRKPAYESELKHLFPCRHHFNRPLLKLCFSSDFLGLPPIRTQRDLSHFLKHSPADLITIPGEEQSYRTHIRSLLLHQEGEVLQCPPFEQIAGVFNVSSQTLRRKLKSEGTSYPRIKDELRLDLAIEKLRSEKISVSEIARLLGFSESRSFTRAFKHWTGLTPKAYLMSKTD
ncbi:MAG: AraC family transcriptional regulator [Amphritea sp.]